VQRSIQPARVNRVQASATITDPQTKISFAEEIDGLQCLGAGCREKKIAFINVKIYSVALYAKADRAAEALASGKTLLSGNFEKMLVIKLARKVDGPTFWNALNDALIPRIAQIATNQATAEDDDGNFMAEVAEAAEVKEEQARDAAEDLGAQVSGQNLDNGAEISLRWMPGGLLRMSINGGQESIHNSNELCQALFDVYLGEHPVSPGALQAFDAGAARL